MPRLRLISTICAKMAFTSSGAMPSDGSSSIRNFGWPISARPIASICCSPPDSVPAMLLLAFGETRKQAEHVVALLPDQRLRRAAGRRPSAGSRARSGSRTPCALPARGDSPRATMRVRRQPVDALAVVGDAALLRLEQAGDRAQRGALAGAVAADQRDDAARLRHGRARCRAARGSRRSSRSGCRASASAGAGRPRRAVPRRDRPRSPSDSRALRPACPSAIFTP